MPLSRVSDDGIFLAVNDAALSMLGAERLEQVLDTSLLEMVAPQSRDSCRVFLSRVAAGDRGSTEVEFTGLGGLAHTLQLHATTHPVSADAKPSVLITFRDVTEYRRLERAVVEAAAREEQRAAAHAAEVARLSAQLADNNANAKARSGDEARAAALEQQLADAERKHHEAAERHAVLQAQARAEVQAAQEQLEATIAEHLARLTEVEEALRTSEARERQVAEQHENDGAAFRLALQQAQDDHVHQIEELRKAVTALEETLAAAKTREEELAATHSHDEAEWRRALDDAIKTHQKDAAELRAAIDSLERSLAEGQQRELHIASTHQATQAEWQRQAEQAAVAHERQAEELKAAIAGLETSVSALTQELEAAVADRNALLNEHKEALNNLDALARERDEALAAHEEIKRTLSAEHDRARAQWENEHQQARTQWEGEHQQLQVKWAAEHAEAQAKWNAEQDVFTKHRAELEERLQALEQQLELISAERTVQAAAAEKQRTEFTAAIGQLESTVGSLSTERDELNNQLMMVGHERLAWSARLDHAERLARAGRLSLSFADDIETALEGVAEYGRRLMGDVGQAPYRASLEQMLAAATAAQALARQLRHDARTVEVDPLEISPVVLKLERTLAGLLSPDITLSVLAGAEGARVGLTSQQVEQVALTLAANRRATMVNGGQVTFELAEVDIDEACARERMASPGPYVLLAVHASGPGVDRDIAPQLFGIPANEETWQSAGPGMSGLFDMVNEWGGYLWAAQEGPDALAFEVYLPRVTADRDATPRGARKR